MSNLTDTIVMNMPNSVPYYDELISLLQRAKNDGCLHVIADWDITECELRMGDTYTVSDSTMQVMNVSYIMAEQRHSAAMMLLDDEGNPKSVFNTYADEILDDDAWVRISRWGESKPKLKLLK